MNEPLTVHEGSTASVQAVGRRRRHGGVAPAGALDFSVNPNPLGPPDSLSVALIAEHLTSYPEPDSATLRHALAQRHGVTLDEILVTNVEALHAAR